METIKLIETKYIPPKYTSLATETATQRKIGDIEETRRCWRRTLNLSYAGHLTPVETLAIINQTGER